MKKWIYHIYERELKDKKNILDCTYWYDEHGQEHLCTSNTSFDFSFVKLTLSPQEKVNKESLVKSK